MAVASLETEFDETERQRKSVEERKRRLKLGLPPELEEAVTSSLTEIEKAKQDFSKTLTPEAYATVSKIFGIVELQLKTILESKEFKLDIDSLTARTDEFNVTLAQIVGLLETANKLLITLNDKVTSEFRERQKLRAKQLEIIDKLNQYLSEYV